MAALTGSQRRWFVFFLRPSLAKKAIFQKPLGEILATKTKSYSKSQHDRSKRDSERQNNSLISYSEFFEHHR